eukprot:TRINITY_DN17451_c0_g5_i1.p1 TRINITY_DN17451_c0_g5~~TRINITY_DN17451_c0_g5_i1.p1  ORF type:complete len:1087 (-),score=251.18 TRINITY_DN17451_c0_g5_i1:13-2799(-)
MRAILAAAAAGSTGDSRGGDGDNSSGDEDPCSALHQQRGLLNVFTDPKDARTLLLDFTELLAERGKAELLVMSMFARGTFKDSDGQTSTLHMPLADDDASETLLQLALSADRAALDVTRPQMSVRTSDAQMREALRLGAWSGWDDALSRVEASCKALGKGRIVVDAERLIKKAFFARGWTKSVISYQVRRVLVFPDNIDLSVELLVETDSKLLDNDQYKRYQETQPHFPEAMTVNFALVRLPARPMAPRAMDDRVGYFTVGYIDLGQRPRDLLLDRPSAGVDTGVKLIQRYDLESLPGKQIRIHVDPTVPPRWRLHFKQGIEAWNEAFRPLGFDDALRAVLPDDADWPDDYHASDSRFNTIAWAVSMDDLTYSVGISKVDPRSGQVLKSDIVMTSGWIRAWLSDMDIMAVNMTQKSDGYRRESISEAGASGSSTLPSGSAWGLLGTLDASLDDSAREEILGAGLRQIVMHETGHILGLRHNFKGSLGVSLECAESAPCTAEHGLTISVMDYLPLNVPAGRVTGAGVFNTKIGAYDKLAIRYGYAKNPHPSRGDAFKPPAFLAETLREAETLPFCSDTDFQLAADPSCERHDLSATPLEWYAQRIQLWVDSWKGLPNTFVPPGGDYKAAGYAAVDILSNLKRIGEKLAKWVGGVNVSRAHRSEASAADSSRSPGALVRPMPSIVQWRSLELMCGMLGIAAPDSPVPKLLDPDVEERISSFAARPSGFDFVAAPLDFGAHLRRFRADLLRYLLDWRAMAQVAFSSSLPAGPAAVGAQDLPVLSCGALLRALGDAIWSPAPNALSRASTCGRLLDGGGDLDLKVAFAEHLRELSKTPARRLSAKALAEVLGESLALRRRIAGALKAGEGGSLAGAAEIGEGSCRNDGGAGLDADASRAFLQHILRILPDPSADKEGTDDTSRRSAKRDVGV